MGQPKEMQSVCALPTARCTRLSTRTRLNCVQSSSVIISLRTSSTTFASCWAGALSAHRKAVLTIVSSGWSVEAANFQILYSADKLDSAATVQWLKHDGGTAGKQPGAGPTPAQRMSFCVCVCACRWCKHVKTLSTRSTHSDKGTSDSSPCTAKHERGGAESFTARRRRHARWPSGAQPQQGTANSSLLHTILVCECA